MNNLQKVNGNEKGFASIVVAFTLIIVMALITIGFAQITRREQQNALTKQLAMQANNAAEAGIADAYNYIKANPTWTPASKTTCTNLQTLSPAGPNPKIDASHAVEYTCLLIDTDPKNLYYTAVQPNSDTSTTFTVIGGPGTLDMSVAWDSARTVVPLNSAAGFKSETTWTYPAVIQVSITPLSSFTRASLTSKSFTAYMYPTSSGSGSVAYNTTNQGPIVEATCVNLAAPATGKRCKATITGIPDGSPGGYLLHFINLYDKSDINITGNITAGAPVSFKGSQDVIDVTGKARDVLKRLQVRIKVDPKPVDVPYTLDGQSICKRTSVYPGNAIYDNSVDPVNNVCTLGP